MFALPALTIRQPWGWAIVHAGKRVENRCWRVRYRGPLAIHVGQGADMADAATVAHVAGVDLRTVREGARVRGAVIAVARLADICSAQEFGRSCDCGPWAAYGQHHWRLEGVRPLADPVPCGGARGLWALPPRIRDQVLSQVRPPAEPPDLRR